MSIMEKGWFEKHRPRCIDDIVFPDKTKEDLIKGFVKQGWIQGNILSYGPGGVGKTTISKVLQNEFIKNIQDVKVLGRKVDDIDKLKSWIQGKSFGSRQRLVIIEEFDNLSKKAQDVLKDELMEKYQPKVSFIATTNNIHKISQPILQRFNIKLNFNSVNTEGIFFRMIAILEKENIQFVKEDLWNFVVTYQNKGIRDLINNLQIGSVNGTFSTKNLTEFFSSAGFENDVLINFIQFINTIIVSDNEAVHKLMYDMTTHQQAHSYYKKILEIIESDFSFNYDFIFDEIIDNDQIFLPIRKLSSEYLQDIDLKKNKKIHFISFMIDSVKVIYNNKMGFKI